MLKVRSGTSVEIQIQIFSEDDLSQPFSLTDVASVSLELYDVDSGNLVHTIPCTVVDTQNGIISFTLDNVDIGIYERRFVLTYVNGKQLIIPNSNIEFVLVW